VNERNVVAMVKNQDGEGNAVAMVKNPDGE
jgi:hypothetical protein